MKPPMTPPENEAVLLQRCRAISGLSLGTLANHCGWRLPHSFHHAKGFVGQLVEYLLGAQSSSRPQPDFPLLGIELKTLPVDANALPRETTYICTAPNRVPEIPEHWESSRVREKIKRILWVPFEADPCIPLPDRRIATPLLWSPDKATESILRQDWEELTSMLHLGQTTLLSAKIGTYLQLRPKAANSRIRRPSLSEQGEATEANPRGFYLRTALTRKILREFN